MTGVDDVVVRLSTTSLTSSSSSGSETRPKNNNASSSSELPLSPPIINGTCDVTDSVVSNFHKPPSSTTTTTASTGAIPKSISFDKTAERGDKELLDDDQKNKRGFFGKLKMSLRNRRGKVIRGTDDLRCYDREAGGDGIDIGKHRLRRIMSEDVTSAGNIVGMSFNHV